MKKGFTLIEMMAVILIVAALSILIIPNITDQVQNKKGDIDEATKQIILTAAQMYKSNNPDATSVTIQDLINNDYLDKGINIKVTTLNEENVIDLDQMCIMKNSECID